LFFQAPQRFLLEDQISFAMPTRPLTQLTLALLKPDLTANSLKVREVFSHIQQNDFNIVAQRRLLWSKNEAEAFYGEHRGRFFFERLCGYMTR
jgi:nucleoside-diphosphate kinase